ncbi:MAG TPA: hypothetical protein DHV28_17590 [Ignavibacteriales bacterium]|nr:hypothetical protein [Ignavibacteriales bacterium]
MHNESTKTYKAFSGLDICSDEDLTLLKDTLRFNYTRVIIRNYGTNNHLLPKTMAILYTAPLPNSIKGSQIRAAIVKTSFDFFDEKCLLGFHYFYRLEVQEVLCKGEFTLNRLPTYSPFLGYLKIGGNLSTIARNN